MRICLVALLLVLSQPSQAQEVEKRETDNLVLQWTGDAIDAAGLEMAADRGERLHAAIEEMLGYAPQFPVTIVLEGPAERPDGTWGYPRVDGWGRVHLYKFGPENESWFNALAHEMVHVFRMNRRPHHDWFFEEGFAEFVARRVDDSIDGFPWYGYDPLVVAGQWVAAGEDIPLADLRADHEGLNMPCKLQSYSLRYSFFEYLGRTFGDEKVLVMSVRDQAGALDDYKGIFGMDFAALEAAWREDLLARYEALPDAAALANSYRTRSPAQYQPVCGD